MTARCSKIIITLLVLNGITSFPLKSPPKVLEFLKKFGYIEPDDSKSEALYTEEGIAETIKTVQKFGAIPETGIIDNATLQLMSSPRCGVPDIIRNKRHKRYVVGSEGWNKRTITYFIANWAPNLGKNLVAKNLEVALNTWGEYGRLTFREVDTPDADIIVAFGSGYHGDRYAFDGPGNILAHAFFPHEEQGFGGDIHFDADEKWVDRKNGKNEDGMDFLPVALHELGHSLGLSHSPETKSIMFPYYQEYDPNIPLHLGYDDILAMYELYIRRNIHEETPATTPKKNDSEGRRSDETTESTTKKNDNDEQFGTTVAGVAGDSTTDMVYVTTANQDFWSFTTTKMFNTSSVENVTPAVYEGDSEFTEDHKRHDTTHHIPSTNSPSLPNICNGYFDSVAVLRDEIFIFKEQYVWRLNGMSKIAEGYPILISQMFPELPKSVKKIDAAYERSDGMIVIFTGKNFWVSDGKNFVENSPMPIEYYGLPSTVDEIDAVQVWDKNGKVYFYKGNIFWRYNENNNQMDEGYPKSMERWRGVPHDLDAATTWKGVTYFFKNEYYWKFDNDWVIVTETSPLPIGPIWMGCPEDERIFLFKK